MVAHTTDVDQFTAFASVLTSIDTQIAPDRNDPDAKALTLDEGVTVEFANHFIGFDPYRFFRTIAAAFTKPDEIGKSIRKQQWGRLLSPLKTLSLAGLSLLFLTGLGNNISAGDWWEGGANTGSGWSLRDPDSLRLVTMVAIPSILATYFVISGYIIKQPIKSHYTGLLKTAQAFSYTLGFVLIIAALDYCFGEVFPRLLALHKDGVAYALVSIAPSIFGLAFVLAIMFISTPKFFIGIFHTSRRHATAAVCSAYIVSAGGIYFDLATHKTIAQEAFGQLNSEHKP